MKKIQLRNNLILKIFMLLNLLFFIGCNSKKEERFSQERFLFGTYIQMIVYSENEKIANSAMEKAYKEIERIDNKYNSKNINSIIYKLNNSENKVLILDDEGKYIFTEIEKMYKITNGGYDITIEPLLELWGFGDNPRKNIPSEYEIKKALEKVDFSKVKIEGNKFIVNGEEKIDTGSFLKGYALEKAKDILLENGIEKGFISSISSIVTIGTKDNGSPWRVGIQNPENPEKKLGIVEIENSAMGVSGDYQTYVEIQGKKYHHIMNKFTGYPIDDKKMVVVICDSGFMADIYSTSFFGMSIEKILDFCNKNQIEVLIVKKDNSIVKTKNFKI